MMLCRMGENRCISGLVVEHIVAIDVTVDSRLMHFKFLMFSPSPICAISPQVLKVQKRTRSEVCKPDKSQCPTILGHHLEGMIAIAANWPTQAVFIALRAEDFASLRYMHGGMKII